MINRKKNKKLRSELFCMKCGIDESSHCCDFTIDDGLEIILSSYQNYWTLNAKPYSDQENYRYIFEQMRFERGNK